ncbi:MAG TPA: patatin-like phospholipase family protein [Thermodesulfovibrionales bacterium]|nr:patatin-like phospholipase family protein [Thermodesulfovibrionales bacterium]
MKKEMYTAIVLQGGGALGAYECGVMKELYESRGPNFKPDVITGISIGAINAAILAGSENPAATLEHVWREGFSLLTPLPAFLEATYESLIPQKVQQYLSALGNESMYRLRPEYYCSPVFAPFFTSSIYDTSPLRATLETVVDLNRLNRDCQVVVTAVNVETGKAAIFGNRLSMNGGVTFDNEDGLSIDHVIASGSLPPAFPMTEIKQNFYWDGGLHSNTPLSEAINCLERCKAGSLDVRRELIIVELVPMEGEKPGNIEEVMSRFFNIIFASKLNLDAKLFSQYSDFVDLAGHLDVLLRAIEADDDLRKKVDKALSSSGSSITVNAIRNHAGYKELMDHRRIDAFTYVPFTAGHALRNASDFSKGSIEARIEAGQQEARKQKIGEHHFLKRASA